MNMIIHWVKYDYPLSMNMIIHWVKYDYPLSIKMIIHWVMKIWLSTELNMIIPELIWLSTEYEYDYPLS